MRRLYKWWPLVFYGKVKYGKMLEHMILGNLRRLWLKSCYRQSSWPLTQISYFEDLKHLLKSHWANCTQILYRAAKVGYFSTTKIVKILTLGWPWLFNHTVKPGKMLVLLCILICKCRGLKWLWIQEVKVTKWPCPKVAWFEYVKVISLRN